MKEFLDTFEFCHEHKQGEETFVITGFFKYTPSTHFQRLTLGKDDDETSWKFVDRITRLALDSVKECQVKAFTKSPAHENLDSYKENNEEIRGLMIFESDDKDELKYYSFCGPLFNEFLAVFGAGARLGKPS